MRNFLICIAAVVLAISINAEENGFEEVKIPFVSGITIYSTGGTVLLQWQNPENTEEYITIYRSIFMIDSLKKAKKIAMLHNNETSYRDAPPLGTYYYAVIVTNKKTMEDYQIVIPYRNTLPQPVTIEKEKYYKITRLQATYNRTIELSWEYESDTTADRELHLYRNTEPITSETILKNSIALAKTEISAKQHQDTPVSGINYYYAAVIENSTTNELEPGRNYTTDPVAIPAGINYLSTSDSSEFIPLPLLSLDENPETGIKFSDPQALKSPLHPEKNKVLTDIVKNHAATYQDLVTLLEHEENAREKHLELTLLPDESIFNPDLLRDTYNKALTALQNGNYKSAIENFEFILVQKPSDQLVIRASYYLGAAYYEIGQYYNSYVYFLPAESSYHKEVSRYLSSILIYIYNALDR